MPEGPEVRTIADFLTRYIGFMLIKIDVDVKSKYKGVVPNMEKLTFPLTIHNIDTRGKMIIFQFTNGVRITSQLGMTGKWLLEKGKHSHISLTLKTDDNKEVVLYFDDARKFGFFDIYIDEVSFLNKFNGIGFDMLKLALIVFDQDVSEDKRMEVYSQHFQEFITCISKTKRKICTVLHDQSCFSGIGNYLRADIMYAAKIHPERKCNEIKNNVIQNIFDECLRVIYTSYKQGGLTIQDYFDPEGKGGTYQTLVYGKSLDSHGNKILKDKFDGTQTVHWVKEVQTL